MDALERQEVVEVTVEPRLRAFQLGRVIILGQTMWQSTSVSRLCGAKPSSFHVWRTKETYRFL